MTRECRAPSYSWTRKAHRAARIHHDGGPSSAYPSSKSWVKPSGKTGSGEKFIRQYHPESGREVSKQFYMAVITQVILEVDLNPSVIAINGKAMTGLYTAGALAETSVATNALAVTCCSISLDLSASLANMRRRTSSAPA